jgi:DNA-binding IclR family transcriptional regulator
MVALEQPLTDVTLQARDGDAESLLCDETPTRGAGEASFLDYCDEVVQVAKIHRVPILGPRQAYARLGAAKAGSTSKLCGLGALIRQSAAVPSRRGLAMKRIVSSMSKVTAVPAPSGDDSLERGMRALAAIAEGARTVDELMRATGDDRQSIQDLLAPLTRADFVRPACSGRFVPGDALHECADQVHQRLREAACEALHELSNDFDASAVLAVPDGGDAVVLVDESRRSCSHYQAGVRHPLDSAAHGRAILAFSSSAARDRRVRAARERGYVTSEGELRSGAFGIAAPIVGDDGFAVASIGVVFSARPAIDEDRLANSTVAAAARVRARLVALTA